MLLFQGRRQPRRACALHHVVRVGEVDLHGLAHFFFAYAHHALDILKHHRERSVIGHAASHAVSQQRGDRSCDLASRFERQRVGRRALGDDAHNPGLQVHAIANRATRADARSLSDRHVDNVDIGHRGEELKPISCDSLDDIAMIRGHEVPAMLVREFLRVLFGFLIVAAKLN